MYIYIYIYIYNNNNNIYLLNHTYNNSGYKWNPPEVIDVYMLYITTNGSQNNPKK